MVVAPEGETERHQKIIPAKSKSLVKSLLFLINVSPSFFGFIFYTLAKINSPSPDPHPAKGGNEEKMETPSPPAYLLLSSPQPATFLPD